MDVCLTVLLTQETLNETISLLEKRAETLSETGKAKVTPFRLKVWAACYLVPSGHVTTYKSIGDFIGCGSAQAIGQALRNNVFAPFVPCHRVVNARGDLHGFSGSTGSDALQRKHAHLEKECVDFDDPSRVAESSICILKMK
mmetsp:Transcript_6507/g.9824  ORF Transcript_6507/g.9824 Transcript_6507/m.9824 type:complete len:142 (-) Transcript_6507:47-472(-)|eukprot:CAMPEP_0201507398 /NCGR_PEP_ID=MMETSP0161_2-20130828/1071_1 /ASSEMBLY_ACC=CAM_ASM_000251 /TAXON_ID=180227 /ORGANISM="Neoparamoeba aestuarina, Strain SoJaBio B1-5/56/2" /LENGTH=141 /DNA_ID=CAMNT_0047901749 /DNA_START=45 /DNA_END=470 /DNA_ORIENTATION=+